MSNISSKYTHMLAAESVLIAEKKANDSSHDGILLFTNFGFIYGKFSNIDPKDKYNVSNVILNSREQGLNKANDEKFSLIGDGSVIVLQDAVVKYSNNMTLNMKEMIVFCDQIVGYYLVNLAQISEQLPQL